MQLNSTQPNSMQLNSTQRNATQLNSTQLNSTHFMPRRSLNLGKGAKKNIKKLTNVSLYVCMSAENRKMLVFMFFSQQ